MRLLWTKRSRFGETRCAQWSQVIFQQVCMVLSGTYNHEGVFCHLQGSSSSSICLLYQSPFVYVTLKDKQAYVGGYSSKRALYEFCLC